MPEPIAFYERLSNDMWPTKQVIVGIAMTCLPMRFAAFQAAFADKLSGLMYLLPGCKFTTGVFSYVIGQNNNIMPTTLAITHMVAQPPFEVEAHTNKDRLTSRLLFWD